MAPANPQEVTAHFPPQLPPISLSPLQGRRRWGSDCRPPLWPGQAGFCSSQRRSRSVRLWPPRRQTRPTPSRAARLLSSVPRRGSLPSRPSCCFASRSSAPVRPPRRPPGHFSFFLLPGSFHPPPWQLVLSVMGSHLQLGRLCVCVCACMYACVRACMCVYPTFSPP